MLIIHEPECFEFYLPPNEVLTIEFYANKNSILLKHFIEGNSIGISILDDQSPYRVMYKGMDVFEKYMDG